ncbi:hypothetical protein ACFPOI_16750 [Nonomuraea angiospora]|uniref:Uncharacterized protein n=1 Tax=Nonomuraea angiospora TaxID=46172 RepID=A0ABR9MID1_9ACTN|nr:hypothetical protein [Nonomuraea angiospora]MBE1592288.1 hypothetical protein [Nonomuraea angiospora]
MSPALIRGDFDDNPCALNVGTAWLVDGVLPKRDVVCEASTPIAN